jgi:hypothetical protein
LGISIRGVFDKSVSVISRSTGAEHQRPQRSVHKRRARLILELAVEVSSRRVKRVDGFSEAIDQDVVAELAEVGAGLHDAPRRIQRAIGGELLYEVSFEVEDVNDPIGVTLLRLCRNS